MLLRKSIILKALGAAGLTAGLVLAAGDGLAAQQRTPPPQSSSKTKGKQAQTPAAPTRPTPPAPWWNDDAIKKELGLTAEQAKTIDQIFTSSKDELASYRENMDREHKELDRLIAESKVEQWVVLNQADRYVTQRSHYEKTRIMTLYRMQRVLTPDQRAKLQTILDRQRGSRGGERDGRDPKAGR